MDLGHMNVVLYVESFLLWEFFFGFVIESTQLARQLHQEHTQMVLVFGLICRHKASNPITSGTHTSGAQ